MSSDRGKTHHQGRGGGHNNDSGRSSGSGRTSEGGRRESRDNANRSTVEVGPSTGQNHQAGTSGRAPGNSSTDSRSVGTTASGSEPGGHRAPSLLHSDSGIDVRGPASSHPNSLPDSAIDVHTPPHINFPGVPHVNNWVQHWLGQPGPGGSPASSRASSTHSVPSVPGSPVRASASNGRNASTPRTNREA